MSDGGKKVQTLRQQFEGLTTSTASNRRAVVNEYDTDSLMTLSKLAVYRDPVLSRSTELLRRGNRNGFIETPLPRGSPALCFASTSPKLCLSDFEVVVDDVSVGTDVKRKRNTLVHGVGCGRESGSDNNRRNGIYLSDSNPSHAEEHCQKENCGDGAVSKSDSSPEVPEDSSHMQVDGESVHSSASSSSSNSASVNNSSSSFSVNSQQTPGFELTSITEPSPPLSSSASSGTAVYGRVKRSNAFRAKDVYEDVKSLSKTKLVLDRVKSLDAQVPSSSSMEEEFEASYASPHRAASVCVRSKVNGYTNHSGVSQSVPQCDSKNSRQQQLCSSNNSSNSNSNSNSSNNNNNNNAAVCSNGNVNKAVNVVTPYQVTDLHSQIRKSQSLAIPEVEYAVPIPRSQLYPSSPPLPKFPPPPLPYHKSANLDSNASSSSNYGYACLSQHRGINDDHQHVVVSASSSAKSASVNSLPPEKPPRTFLYDILYDLSRNPQQQQQQKQLNKNNNNNDSEAMGTHQQNNNGFATESGGVESSCSGRGKAVGSLPGEKMSPDQQQQQQQQQPRTRLPLPKQSPSAPSAAAVSSATRSINSYPDPPAPATSQSHAQLGHPVNNTNTNYGISSAFHNHGANLNYLGHSVNASESNTYKSMGDPTAVVFNNNNKPNTYMTNSKSQSSVHYHGIAAGMIYSRQPLQHPPLIRSKTESQLIVKGKNQKLHPSVHHADRSSPEDEMNNIKFPLGKSNTLMAQSHQQQQHQHQLQLAHHQRNLNLRQTRYPINIHPSAWEAYAGGGAGLLYPSNTSNNNSNNPLSKSSTILPHDYYRLNSNVNSHYFHEGNSTPDHALYADSVVCDLRRPTPCLGGSNNNVNQCQIPTTEERLCEKSKSDWTLNQAGRKCAKNALSTENNPPIALRNSNNSRAENASLDSTGSSNSSSTPIPNNKMPRPKIQQSIQNLVNQLFATPVAVQGKDATSSTDSGIQLGSESLSSCDTPVGDSTTDTGDSDCENDLETSNNARQVVEARKGYIRRVSSIRVQELGTSINHLIQNSKKPLNGEPLFECLLVVGLDRDPYTGIYHPYIKEKFPTNANLAPGTEQLCFPDSLEWPCHEGASAQFYTLAITDQRGARKYGCCFRILPEGAPICIPITYCIISSHRAIGFHREVLREVASRHGEPQRNFWLNELFKKPFPTPGASITLQESAVEEIYQDGLTQCYNKFTVTPPRTTTLRRRSDHRLDEGDLVTLLTTVDLSIVIKLFGSLLLERKVVLTSRALCTLSLCVEALESMLYPFTWQHTFVPILPLNMTGVLDAPAPFLIGVLCSSQTPWNKTLDEGIVVDLDNNKVLSCVGDEGTILPKRVHRRLRDSLQLVLNLADQKECTKNVLISECFIRMFVETLGHHAHHIVVQQDGQRIFERESFVKTCDSKATQNFLEWFSETSMFNQFTEIRLKNPSQYGLFEQRVVELSENSSHGSTPLSLKNKFFAKGSRQFGSWFKETFVMK